MKRSLARYVDNKTGNEKASTFADGAFLCSSDLVRKHGLSGFMRICPFPVLASRDSGLANLERKKLSESRIPKGVRVYERGGEGLLWQGR
jgi:hypothetical protein